MSGLPIARRQMLLVSALVAVLTAVSVTVHLADWLGSWGETSRALEDSTTLTYPVVAGTAAWYSASPKRRRYRWMIDSASRSAYSVYLRTAISLGLLAAAGFVVLAIAASIATATQANFGQPAIASLFTIVAGFFATASFGVFIAAFLPSLLSPITSLVAVYAVEVLVDTGKPSLLPLAGLIVADPRERTYRSTAFWMLEVRGVWLLAVGLLLVAMAARAGSRWLIPFIVACVAATPLLLAGDTGMAVNKAAVRAVCHYPTPKVTVCLTAARDHVYSDVWSALAPEIALLPGLAARHWHLFEEGLAEQYTVTYEDGRITVPFGVINGVNGNAHLVDRKQLQADFSTRLLQGNCGPDSSGSEVRKPSATAQDVIQAWLLSRLNVPIDGMNGFGFPQLTPASLDFGAMSGFERGWDSMNADNRRAWLRKHGQQVVECQLSNSDLTLP